MKNIPKRIIGKKVPTRITKKSEQVDINFENISKVKLAFWPIERSSKSLLFQNCCFNWNHYFFRGLRGQRARYGRPKLKKAGKLKRPKNMTQIKKKSEWFKRLD